MLRSYLLYLLLLQAVVYAVHCMCGPYWQVIGSNYCYRVGNARLTWKDADTECKKMDSILVRLYNSDVQKDVQHLLSSSNYTRWWTGLNDIATSRDWVFDIAQYAVYPQDPRLFRWINEPDDTAVHLQNCGALNIQGSVSDERCSDHHRYICEYSNTQGGSCLPNWFNYSDSCYHFPVGQNSPWFQLTWNAANVKCQSILNGTSASNLKSHLLFIDSDDEQNYIRYKLPQISLTSEIWWIGLTDEQQEGQYTWTDGRLIGQFVYWAQEANNLGAAEKCVYVNSNGRLADLNCDNTENYVCMKESDVNQATLPGLGCPSRWTRAGQYCYLIETQTKHTWTDAQSACSQSGATLIKVDTRDKQTWLDSQNGIFESGLWFWTGLNNQHNADTWRWADSSAADMSLVRWTIEPNNYKGDENCAVILKHGTFNDVNCQHRAGYICEFNPETSACPNNWPSYNEEDNLNCYYIGDELVTFDEAHDKCKDASFPLVSNLVAIDTPAELKYIIDHISSRNSLTSEYYTGLTDTGHEGIWLYDTGWNPPPDKGLIPWSRMPAFPTGNENCVVIIFGGQYINTQCNRQQPYICERLADGVQASGSSQLFTKKFSVSSVFILIMYFLAYGVILHYILHVTYILFPAYA